MMKIHYLLILTLLHSQTAHSAEKAAVVYDEIKEQGSKNKKMEGDSTLQKLLTIKGVDTQYKACQTAGVSVDKLPTCLWIGDSSLNVPALSDDLKKQVQQKYAEESTKENSRSPANSTPKKTDLDLTLKSKHIGIDYMSDPAVVALSKVFEKKLEEALSGDELDKKDTKKTVSTVDHAKFIGLYKTELGKTIINAFTSYCMEVDIDSPDTDTGPPACTDSRNNPTACNLYILTSTKEATVNKNIKSLKTADLSSQGAASSAWTGCIKSVTQVCYTKKEKFSSYDSTSSNQEILDSKTRACTIVDYVKSARKNLIFADDQIKFYDKLERVPSADIANAKIIPDNEKNSVNNLTTLTSKEVEDSYQVKNKPLEKEIAECVDNSDTEKCKKFISTDAEEKKKNLAEFALRQYAQENQIDEKLQSKEDVEKYLLNEGYQKDKIKGMISNDSDLQQIKAEIKERYKNEREAIIANMAEKIKSKTTTKDGFNQTDDSSKMAVIKKEISDRPAELKQLVHFNNIVSSYLTITSGNDDSKSHRNVASLFSELKNGSKDIKGTDGKDHSAEIQKNAGNAGLKEEKDSNQNAGANLNVDTLNGLLKYSTEK